jgi:hypothetical protein
VVKVFVFEELAGAGSNFRFRSFQVSLILVVGAMNFVIRCFPKWKCHLLDAFVLPHK